MGKHFKTNSLLKKYKNQFSTNEINKKSSKTENVFFQTSEEKEITVSSNKKSEEVPASIEKRLEDLLDLKEKGLIDGDDYEIKKKEILKDM